MCVSFSQPSGKTGCHCAVQGRWLLNEGRASLGVETPSLVPLQGGPGSGDKANGEMCVCVCVCVCTLGPGGALRGGDKANREACVCVCALGPGGALRWEMGEQGKQRGVRVCVCACGRPRRGLEMEGQGKRRRVCVCVCVCVFLCE